MVERVAGGQTALKGDKLAFGTALESDEEEAGVDLAGARFDRFGVGVAASEDALAAVVMGAGEAYVSIGRDQQFAVGGSGGQLDRVELAVAAKRSACELFAADRAL